LIEEEESECTRPSAQVENEVRVIKMWTWLCERR